MNGHFLEEEREGVLGAGDIAGKCRVGWGGLLNLMWRVLGIRAPGIPVPSVGENYKNLYIIHLPVCLSQN